MESAIEKVLFGDTNHEFFELPEEWKRLRDESYKIYEEFYAGLTEEQKKQFNEMYEYDSGKAAELEVLYYKKGFKLGLALAAEAFLK